MAQARSTPEADPFPELEEIDPDAAVVNVIRDAISLRRQVLANYPGDDGETYYHEFCPHILGMKGRRYRVLAYQFAGDTAAGWKCFKLFALTNVSSRGGPWHTDEDDPDPDYAQSMDEELQRVG